MLTITFEEFKQSYSKLIGNIISPLDDKKLLKQFKVVIQDDFKEELATLAEHKEYKKIMVYSEELFKNSKLLPAYQKILPYVKTLLLSIDYKKNLAIDARIYSLKLVLLFGDSKIVLSFITKAISSLKSPKDLISFINLPIPEDPKSWDVTLSHGMLRKKELLEDSFLTTEYIKFIDKIQSSLLSDARFGDTAKKRKGNIPSQYKKKDIQILLARISYGDVEEKNLYDATVFYKYRMKPSSFKEWLEVKEQAHDSEDTFPAKVAYMNGSAIPECKDLSIIKLHAKDPRNGVLGEITGCCQNIGVSYHVQEDTRSKFISILIITRNNEKRMEEDKDNLFLSKQCKDEDIVGFIRVYQALNKNQLVFDVLVIRSVFEKTVFIKKIAKMLANYSISLVENEDGYLCEKVWFGSYYSHTDLCMPYFSIEDKESLSIQPPADMEHSECRKKFLMYDKTKPLSTLLIADPSLIKRIQKESILENSVNFKHILSSLIAFGSMGEIIYFLSLLSNEQLQEISPLSLACAHNNQEVMDFFLNHNNNHWIHEEKNLNVFVSIAKTEISSTQKINYFKLILENSNDEQIIKLLTMRLPDGTNSLTIILSSKNDEEVILSYLQALSSKGILLEELLFTRRYADLRIIKEGFDIWNNKKILTYIFSILDPDDLARLFIGGGFSKSPLYECNADSLKFIIEHKKLDRGVNKKILLSNFEYKKHNKVQIHNILTICFTHLGKLNYLIYECSIINPTEKRALFFRSIKGFNYANLNIIQAFFLSNRNMIKIPTLFSHKNMLSKKERQAMLGAPVFKEEQNFSYTYTSDTILGALSDPTVRFKERIERVKYLISLELPEALFFHVDESGRPLLERLFTLASAIDDIIPKVVYCMAKNEEQFIDHIKKYGNKITKNSKSSKNQWIALIDKVSSEKNLCLPRSYYCGEDLESQDEKTLSLPLLNEEEKREIKVEDSKLEPFASRACHQLPQTSLPCDLFAGSMSIQRYFYAYFIINQSFSMDGGAWYRHRIDGVILQF